MTFLVISLLGLIATLAIALFVPAQGQEGSAPDIRGKLTAFRDRNLLASLAITALGWVGFMTFYGYIAPLAERVAGFSAADLTWVLVVVGTQRFAQAMTRRERLYGEFIEEASRLFTDALTHELDDPSKFVRLYALIGRLRLFAPTEVIARAEEVMQRIIEIYDLPNRDFRNPAERQRDDIDVLRAFTSANGRLCCRSGLLPIRLASSAFCTPMSRRRAIPGITQHVLTTQLRGLASSAARD